MRAFRNLAILGLMLAVVAALVAAEPHSRQARIAQNEAETIANLRDILAAAQAYKASNGTWPSTLECLGAPQACGFPAGTPPFLDALRGAVSGVPGVTYAQWFTSHGYLFIHAVSGVAGDGVYEPGVLTFTISAEPTLPGESGIRFFDADHTGVICEGVTDTIPNGGDSLPAGCVRL